jgi:O-antigen/teichoic acid export membrane protein
MWLQKPLYESLPYYYFAVGVVALLAAVYVGHGRWLWIGAALGLGSMLAGVVVWLRRRDYRAKRARLSAN